MKKKDDALCFFFGTEPDDADIIFPGWNIEFRKFLVK